MKFIKSVFDFYISSSIHVAIEVCCFVLLTCFQFHIKYDPVFLAFIFFATITGYNFIKYAGVAQLHHLSLTKNLKLIQVFSLLSFLALVYLTFKLPFKTLLMLAFFSVFTVFYALPIFPKKKNLRSIKGIKIFVITIVVTGVTVIVPLIHHKLAIGFDAILTFIQRMAFIIAVIIPFEIRDLKFDKVDLGTIPQKVGVKKTKFLATGLLTFFFLMELLKSVSAPAEIISVAIISLISAGFIWFSSQNQPKYYCSFWVEGIPILWLGILLMLEGFL